MQCPTCKTVFLNSNNNHLPQYPRTAFSRHAHCSTQKKHVARTFSFNGYIRNHSRLFRRCRSVCNGFVPCHSQSTLAWIFHAVMDKSSHDTGVPVFVYPQHRFIFYIKISPATVPIVCTSQNWGKTMLPSRFIFRTYRLTIFYLIVFRFSPCSGHFSHRLPFYFPRIHRRGT